MGHIGIEELSDSLRNQLENMGLSEEQVNDIVKQITGNKAQLQTTNKNDLVSAINEVFQSGVNAKQGLVEALASKDVEASTSESWDELNDKVKNISHPALQGKIVLTEPISSCFGYTSIEVTPRNPIMNNGKVLCKVGATNTNTVDYLIIDFENDVSEEINFIKSYRSVFSAASYKEGVMYIDDSTLSYADMGLKTTTSYTKLYNTHGYHSSVDVEGDMAIILYRYKNKMDYVDLLTKTETTINTTISDINGYEPMVTMNSDVIFVYNRNGCEIIDRNTKVATKLKGLNDNNNTPHVIQKYKNDFYALRISVEKAIFFKINIIDNSVTEIDRFISYDSGPQLVSTINPKNGVFYTAGFKLEYRAGGSAVGSTTSKVNFKHTIL